MKLQFHKSDDKEGVIKATIHRSGRLGFSMEASNYLKLHDSTGISIATDADEDSKNYIYILIHDKIEDGSFELKQAGEYYYLNTTNFFNKLGIDYRKPRNAIIFDILDFEYEGKKMYKLRRRK